MKVCVLKIFLNLTGLYFNVMIYKSRIYSITKLKLKETLFLKLFNNWEAEQERFKVQSSLKKYNSRRTGGSPVMEVVPLVPWYHSILRGEAAIFQNDHYRHYRQVALPLDCLYQGFKDVGLGPDPLKLSIV